MTSYTSACTYAATTAFIEYDYLAGIVEYKYMMKNIYIVPNFQKRG